MTETMPIDVTDLRVEARSRGRAGKGLLDKVPGGCIILLIMKQAVPVGGRHEGHSEEGGAEDLRGGIFEGLAALKR